MPTKVQRVRGQRHGSCRLHRREELLCESHVLSKTLLKWFKNQGPSPAVNVVNVHEPAGRMKIAQDGIKEYLLSNDAEQLIGRSEKLFKELAFDRFNRSPREPIRYGPWMLRFAVSVAWRLLEYGRDREPVWARVVEAGGNDAADQWRRFLLAEIADPAPYDMHLIPVIGDGLDMQNYIAATLETNVVSSSSGEAYACAKLGRLLLLGTIRDPFRALWDGTRINMGDGSWGGAGTELSVPYGVQTYLQQRASTNQQHLANAADLQRRARRRSSPKG